MELRVAAFQMAVTSDVDANAAALQRAIAYAAAERAQVLLTPEGSLSGYTHAFDRDRVARALAEVTASAREARVGLALGTCFQEDDDLCYNQVRFYGADGRFMGFHSKTLTCGSLDDPPTGECEHYAVAPLRLFDFAGVPVGALICNDLWANPGCTPQPDPHLTHRLADMGARVVFHAANGGRDGGEWSRVCWNYHDANLRMRAAASRLWVVTVDNCHPTDLPCSAPSGVVGPDGRWVARAPDQGEHLFAVTLPLDP